jgi:hypothetical protein
VELLRIALTRHITPPLCVCTREAHHTSSLRLLHTTHSTHTTTQPGAIKRGGRASDIVHCTCTASQHVSVLTLHSLEVEMTCLYHQDCGSGSLYEASYLRILPKCGFSCFTLHHIVVARSLSLMTELVHDFSSRARHWLLMRLTIAL